ncbi:MAG: L-2-amino-thiazoline-4-carboxylic acid hydrolase [Clostridia bacterium]|nr:L-2-amino-thiazoline-4-carboxylic acid hydrolase [Clostridia bacterium]
MAAMDRMIKKGFIAYAKKHYPGEAERIVQRADELFPVLYAKAPDIGGKENLMSYNLDLLILSASFYEASDHRIDGEAIDEIAREIFGKYRFLRGIVNVNRKWQMKLFRGMIYKRYVPYAKLVEEKVARGEWNNTWRIAINPRNTDEGVCFELTGCPLADYARANGYENLLPHMCAADHLMPELVHAKLIRTHTCALGSPTCDYWYVGDESETAKRYANVKMV